MKLINTLSGGYRRVMDTLLGLQTEMVTAVNAPFGSLGVDLVLSGCAVTNNGNGTVNIASGIMYVGGNTLRFDGASNIASDGSMAIITGGTVTSFPFPFADGSTKNLYSEQKAVVAAQDPSNTAQIKIYTTLYNLQQYIKDQINASEAVGTIKEVYDFDGTFLSNFDQTGAGVKAPWINWALDNGNNHTPGTAGMALIGAGTYTDPVSGLQTVYTYGTTGGEVNHKLVIAEMPSHAHGYVKTQGGIDFGDGSTRNSNTSASSSTTDTAGGDGAHNNMMPYNVVYRVVKIK